MTPRPESAEPSRIRRWLALVLVGTALTGGLVGAPAAPATATDDSTVGIAAAPAKSGTADGRTRFSLIAAAGQQLTDSLLVRNTGSEDEDLTVLATDAYDTVDGAFSLLDDAAAPAGAGSWVAFEEGRRTTRVHLTAGGQAVVPFTVSVPADARPGDHAAGIVVTLGVADSSVGASAIEHRLATRLYVRVQGTVSPALVVRSVKASQPLGGNPFSAPTTITAVVENIGDVALTAQAQAYVHTWFGRSLGAPASDDVAELLPGATRTLTFEVGSVGRVGYLAPHVTLTPGADADAYAFTLPDVDGRGTAAAIPWLLVIAVVIAAVVGLLVVRRRRSLANANEAPDEGTTKEPAAAGERR